ncbi:hypothetical protein [Labrys wisconsinensis]|uniref:Uncharacterized protein n=1 Tax=Labrys wisconsinensis TaxID=425677 RepID=A0ABU0JHF9_9HYPH|nr:hypothetical protein [Labrys wisconsinensis]MDQ0473726.1 hypothetical protein [Labrys wisconsinensis]
MTVLAWFSELLSKAALRPQRAEMLAFHRELQGLSGRDLGFFIALVADIRNRLAPRWDLLDPAAALRREPQLCAVLQRQIAALTRQGRTGEAARLALWLHTLRAVAAPELRAPARAIWHELERGLPYARAAATHLRVAASVEGRGPGPLVDDLAAFPRGFEPAPLRVTATRAPAPAP